VGLHRDLTPLATTRRPSSRPADRPPAGRPRPSRGDLPRLPREVDELELEIEKLVAGGDGLGRWQGLPIFVPRSAPGDRLRVRITERRPGYARGEIVDLLTPGAGRRPAPCPHFADCGGCDLQHLDERTQLTAKCGATLETLRRISRIELPAPAEILAGAPFGYRLRTQLHLEAGEAGVSVGYFARGSHRLVPIAACPVLTPALERSALGLSADLALPLAARRVDLAVGDGDEIAAAPPLPALPGRELRRRVAGFELHYDARCFFQGHAGLLDRFVARVVGDAEGARAFDLYGGVGLFALPLSRRYGRVVLVEGDRVAARYARKNAQLAEAGNLEVECRAVETWIAAHLPAGADRVVVDPPRDGLSTAVRRLLVARPAAKLTYVSCHPAALARDLGELAEVYRVESIVLVDLFPQTGHLEVVVQLGRKEP